jgi:hypothetical protein
MAMVMLSEATGATAVLSRPVVLLSGKDPTCAGATVALRNRLKKKQPATEAPVFLYVGLINVRAVMDCKDNRYSAFVVILNDLYPDGFDAADFL